jgi:integration host factor subunit alpha
MFKEEEQMTKADIIQRVHEKLGFPKKDSAEIVESVFGILKENLSCSTNVKISGFGNFIVREKEARKGRNPQTGDAIDISARRVVVFKPSQVLRKALNED